MLGRASVVWRVGGLFFLWMCTSHVNVWAAKTYTRHPLQLTKFSRALERFHKRKPGDSQAHRKEILRLANWGGEHAFPLLRTVMRSYSWEMHEYTVDIFQKINRKKVTQVLLACLQSRDATTRENAAEVLTRRQGKALTRGLIRLLRHRNWRVRKLAAELLDAGAAILLILPLVVPALAGLGDAPVRWIADDALTFVERAVRRGEELLLSYVDPALPGPERRKRLRASFFFECKCAACRRDVG
mgnify:CR=1 FL=1